MATDKVDMSLDDIIKQQRKTRGGGGGGRGGGGRGVGGRGRGVGRGRVRGGSVGGRGFARNRTRGFGRGGGRFGFRGGVAGGVIRGGVQKQRRGIRQPAYTRGQVEGRWQHDLFRSELTKAATARDGSRQGKLLISNLEFGVNDSDMSELFTEFGPLRRAAVHYDRSGRSLGTAEVLFEMRSDAVKALHQYNNVPLDGRPMKIQLVGESVIQTTPRPPVAARTGGGARRQGTGGGAARQGNFRQSFGQRGRGRGRGRGGRGGRGGNAGRSNMTKEQLDAQLDAYKMDVN